MQTKHKEQDMEVNAKEVNDLTDDQMEQELKALIGKEGRTAEDETKLSELKEERSTRYQKRIDKLSWERKTAAEEAERLRKEVDDLRKERDERETAAQKIDVERELISVGGQKYYSDKALIKMIKAGELSDEEAWEYQRKRQKEEVKAELRAENEAKSKQNEWQTKRQSDVDAVMKEYPHFNVKHPDFDPNDKLYKLADELFTESYQSVPDGLSKAIRRAKQILRLDDRKPDISDDLSVGKSRSVGESHGRSSKIELNDDEKETAKRLYVQSGIVNPKTGRPYTDAEAIEKATKAKNERSRR